LQQLKESKIKKDLFLCHASENKENLVRPVADELKRRKLSVWFDEREILPGMDFMTAINSGMKEAHAVVVFFSANFLHKRWPLNELNNFIAMGKPLIPVVYDLSITDILENYPLLSSTYMMLDVRNPSEIGRRVARAYEFMRIAILSPFPVPQLSDSLESCSGIIRSPADGSAIDRHILAEGCIKSLPKSTWLWLIVEIGGLKWPKEPEVFVSGNAWTGEAIEGGRLPDGRFVLSLYVVGKAGHEKIKAWIEQGRLSGSYPGFTVIDDSRQLQYFTNS
jgi:hypothetical protein